ncbi:hypothetical protein [Terasakiella pusilla]|uniref:hypothetical protein n=1 Tax=Terasakiella pusilla TaxID=64973 RepID=UPI003AA7EE9D
MSRGKLIVAVGLPGAGKSSISKELSTKIDAVTLLEPEEENWGKAIKDRERCGKFTALNWFRSERVPLLYEAEELVSNGVDVIIDTYYDKLLAYYIGDKHMEWLIDKDDPYFPIAEAMAKQDLKSLPNADIIVILNVNEKVWQQFLSDRGRVYDQEEQLQELYAMQSVIVKAAMKFASDFGAQVINFKQEYDSPAEAADRLYKILCDAR